MRMLPFFKPKKGFMIAGGGLETSGGGGGGGGSNVTVLEGTLTGKGEQTILSNVTGFDAIIGVVNGYYTSESRWYRFPIGYSFGGDTVNARVTNNNLQIIFNTSGYGEVTYKVFITNLVTSN